MPGRMCPLKKHRNVADLPLALNPMKSKDVLAVLAERNQAVVPVGAWVEPASPNSYEIPAYTSACIIEEELKEQLRRKEEALKHFQRQVKHRVNQQIRLRKKQQLQKSYEAAEKGGSITTRSFDPGHLTLKRTSVFPSNSNAAFGSFSLPTSQKLGDAIENQSELFQQQAQALSQTMKLARHRLASFKTGSGKMAVVLPKDKRKASLIQEKVKFKNPLFEVMEEKEQNQLGCQSVQSIPPESQGDLKNVQSVTPEDQSVEPDTQVAKLAVLAAEPEGQATETETQDIMVKACNIELEDGNTELGAQDFLPKDQGILPKDSCVFPESQNTLCKYQDQNFLHKDKDCLPTNQHVYSEEQDIPLKCQDEAFLSEDQDFCHRDQCVLPKDQNILSNCQDQDFLLKGQSFLPGSQCVLPQNQDILPKCQDQDFVPEDQSFLRRDQCVLPQNQNILPKCQDQEFVPEDQYFLPRDQCVLQNENIIPKCKDQDCLPKGQKFLSKDHSIIPNCQDQDLLPKDQRVLPKDQNTLGQCQKQNFPSKHQGNYFCQPTSALTAERWKKEWPTSAQQYLALSLGFQGQSSTSHQLEQKEAGDPQENRFLNQTSSFMSEERMKEESPLDYHQSVPAKIQYEPSGEQHRNCGPASHDMTNESGRKDLLPECSGHALHEIQDCGSAREQKASVGTAELQQGNLLVDNHQHPAPRVQRGPCSGPQVYKYQSGLGAEFQTSLANHSGIDKEERKKERQKQYLRHRRLFMDIEREQVKEQKRQKAQQKKQIEKIKQKKEQQCFVEEQRTLRLGSHRAPYSEQKMSDRFSQLQLEEMKGAKEKMQQKEKEYVRYVEALRAQVQEKMKLYNITLPPLCFCGPDFWDAHPDTCANNCIFYKNHQAYSRALCSVISSSDVSEGHSTLRNAIHNFASAHRRILKNM
ncbi:coiled-coil domain-containing protein 15 isoform X3 [Cavia porcellus]|uniref:coiled-coil domain-containing protein 15 isoform X3 n=1 Tax=Cavia porcellus TaxID=10141 RepID=UPI002FE3ABC6